MKLKAAELDKAKVATQAAKEALLDEVKKTSEALGKWKWGVERRGGSGSGLTDAKIEAIWEWDREGLYYLFISKWFI